MENNTHRKLKVIYLLGNSHSGSTVLCFYIGSFRSIFFSGELKGYSNKVNQRVCTCNILATECPFWTNIMTSNPQYFSKERAGRTPMQSIKSTVKGFFGNFKESEKLVELNLQRSLLDTAKTFESQTEYILDSSKSLGRLQFLESIAELDIKVIYLQRNFRANMASFIKRGYGFWHSYFRLKSNNFINWLYLLRTKLPVLRINYESFISNYEVELNRIADFAEVSTDDRVKNLQEIEFHIITGNLRTRKQFVKRDHSLSSTRNTDKYFSSNQKRILDILGEKLIKSK